jgi:putative tricarboxylic transport membrane protein
MNTRSPINLGELLVSFGLVALGIYVLIGTQSIGATQGYSQVGPRAFPYLIGSGLLLIGGMLVWHAASGGWRNVPMDQEGHATPDWVAFGILSAGIVLHMASIGWAGFILASTFLFILIARGFGSRQLWRDVLVGVILSAIAYFIFTRWLGLNLPRGLLGV